jgi:mannan endo-1,4-beta-mannosidase
VVRLRWMLLVSVLLVALAGCIPTATSERTSGTSTTTTSSTTTTTAPPTPSPYVAARDGKLWLAGNPYNVVGVNAYELATYWGVNAGCGAMLDDASLDAFFAALPADTMVRVWGFQGSMGTNYFTHQREWGPLDRIVAAAGRHGDRLIMSLGNQAGDCDDGHWKDPAWYAGGYRDVYPGDGYTVATTSYWDWAREVVTRYRNSTAIGMWELINEPEASTCAAGYTSWQCGGHLTCPDEHVAAAALEAFFDTVGTEIKRLDPNHLVESGSLGGPQCGWVDADFAQVSGSPGVDVLSYHDYESGALPTFLASRLATARVLGKPLIVGELGVVAGDGGTGCPSRADRRTIVADKLRSQSTAGVASTFLWDWVPDPRTSECTYDVGSDDPSTTLLETATR